MKSINLIFGCHSHQPVGNFGFVFEQAYEKSYKPFVDVLERFPSVRVTMHFTGPLWDWFAEHRPAYIQRLAGLSRAGQIEIMGGGYYEPLLCAIPERDAIAQIERMHRFTEEHFGVPTRGMWLTERVWEPQMARILSKAGVEYTALDDTHFLCSGLRPDQLFGYYMTEDEGYTLKVFPIIEKLRYLVPFHQVSETIDFLRREATEDGLRCAVLHDDGEKFGVWPGTYHSVYEEGWLAEFFQALTENQGWLHSVRYEDYLAKAKALGRTYITCASYQEMMAWALPSEMQRQLNSVLEEVKADPVKQERFGPFLRGGFWRSFLAKYEESNNIQKRMLRVSARLARLHALFEDDPRIEEAESLLHQGQCNCAYWHGVFGGLYLNHLRTAVYEKLVASDAIMDALEGCQDGFVRTELTDFDGDGNADAILENAHLALFFSPVDGGTLVELDCKQKPFNIINTLTRREEPYHDALLAGHVQVGEVEGGGQSIHELVRAKETGLEKFLVYDPYRRVSLRDLVLPAPVSTEILWAGRHAPLGGFATGAYEVETGENWVRLGREAELELEGRPRLRIEKLVTLPADASAVDVRYEVRLLKGEALRLVLGVELAVNFQAGAAFDRYYWSENLDLARAPLGKMGCDGALSHLALRDDWQRLECAFRFSEPAQVHRFALETVSQSEGGQERVYQGSIVTPCWWLACGPGETQTRDVRIEISRT